MRQGWGRYFNPSRGVATNGILRKVREKMGEIVGGSFHFSIVAGLLTPSRASSLPQGTTPSLRHAIKCGSELARDEVGTGADFRAG